MDCVKKPRDSFLVFELPHPSHNDVHPPVGEGTEGWVLAHAEGIFISSKQI